VGWVGVRQSATVRIYVAFIVAIQTVHVHHVRVGEFKKNLYLCLISVENISQLSKFAWHKSDLQTINSMMGTLLLTSQVCSIYKCSS
jgi:hypothetical protein